MGWSIVGVGTLLLMGGTNIQGADTPLNSMVHKKKTLYGEIALKRGLPKKEGAIP